MVEQSNNPESSGPSLAGQPGHTDGHQAGEVPFHPQVHYERTDARFGCILSVLVAAIILAVVVFYVVWHFLIGYLDYQAETKNSRFPLANSTANSLPAQPRLEQINRMAGIESANVFAREASKEAILHSFGKTQDAGYVRIPIDSAMDLLAQQDLGRTRPQAGEQSRGQDGLVDGGGPNSGRMFRRNAP